MKIGDTFERGDPITILRVENVRAVGNNVEVQVSYPQYDGGIVQEWFSVDAMLVSGWRLRKGG